MLKALSALLVVIGSIVPLAMGQDGPSPFRVDSELVVIDLVALDSDGRFVGDLHASEIQLREDGKPQIIQFITRISGLVAIVTLLAGYLPAWRAAAVNPVEVLKAE